MTYYRVISSHKLKPNALGIFERKLGNDYLLLTEVDQDTMELTKNGIIVRMDEIEEEINL